MRSNLGPVVANVVVSTEKDNNNKCINQLKRYDYFLSSGFFYIKEFYKNWCRLDSVKELNLIKLVYCVKLSTRISPPNFVLEKIYSYRYE